MAKRLRWLVVGGAAGLVLAVGIVAWQYWPVALRYQQNRTVEAGRAVVRRYVARQDSLRDAACQLASEIRKLNELSFRLAVAEPGSPRKIIDEPRFLPIGANPNDPRVQEVTLNAYRNTLPAWIPSKDRIGLTHWYDSTMRARGLKVVECAA
jgi:hypothetical protein